MENKGFAGSVSSNVQTPVISEKPNKRGKEAVIDSEDEEQRTEKRTKLSEDSEDIQPGFSLQLGEEKNVPTSPRRHENTQEQVPLIKQVFAHIGERNQKMKASMEAQAEFQITLNQTRLLTAMDLEKDQFKIAFHILLICLLVHPIILIL